MSRLASYGFTLQEEELFTPAVAGATLLRERQVETVAPFVAPDLLEDLAEFELCGGVVGAPCANDPHAVLIGDLGRDWSADLLNQAFRHVMEGAWLVALQKGRYWMGSHGLELDAGAYVAALEFATGQDALLCGKPREEFFLSVLQSVGARPPFDDAHRPVMVGDDLWNDVAGAQQAGLAGWLVRTGKFRPDELETSGVSPDRVTHPVSTTTPGQNRRRPQSSRIRMP